MKVLVVEDDSLLKEFVYRCLVDVGFTVHSADDGLQGYRRAKNGTYDVIVLDINLPSMLGTDVCERLRAEGVLTPILFLSSHNTKDDRVKGLNLGADDYLVKPFSHDELIARVKALSRRPKTYASQTIQYKNLTIDTAKHIVTASNKTIKLTPKEFELLELLARNPETVLSREYLLKHVWGVTIGNTSNRLEVCIRGLRKKLQQSVGDELINTEYGVGYKLAG